MRRRPRTTCAVAWLAAQILALGASAEPPSGPRIVPPRPDWILGPSLLRTPPIDAVRFCSGARVDPEYVAILERAARDPESALRRVNAMEEPDDAGAELLGAALEARLADAPETRARSHGVLRGLLTRLAPRGLASCGYLELARLELHLGLHPEAAASSRRADDLAEDPGARAALRDSSGFLRAEALYLGGRSDAAGPLYLELLDAGDARIARAARLRLADLRFDEGAGAQVLEDYTRVLGSEQPFGADPLRWAPRAAEAALAAGDLRLARSWLVRLLEREESMTHDLPSWIRLADVRAAEGRRGDSRTLLTKLDTEHAGTPLGMLARLRIFDLGIEKMASQEVFQTLRRLLAETTHVGIGAYARLVLGRRLLDNGDLDASIPVLVRASYDSAAPDLAGLARSELERALRQAAEDARDDEGCARLVQRLGGIRSLLIRTARDAQPFRRLGECYEQLGLPVAALDVYRSLARAFGAAVATDLTLPVARASFAAGDLASARTAAASQIAAHPRAAPAWRLLLAEVELAQGRAEPAAALLAGLVHERLSPEVDARTLLLLARATQQAPDSANRRSLLRRQIQARAALDPGPHAREHAQAALVAAALHRRAGQPARSRALYEQALAWLPPGASAAEAAYWVGVLRPGGAVSAQALDRAAQAPAPAPFARLASARLALEQLRERLGVGSGRDTATAP